MPDRVSLFRMPTWVQDVLLAAFVTVMQVQGTLVRNSGTPEAVLRPLSDLGYLGYVLLTTSGVVVVVRRRWPVAVFVVTALASVIYYSLGFPDGPGWLGLFAALYTLTAHGDGYRSLRVAGVGIVVLTVVWLIAGADTQPPAAIGWVYFRIGVSVMSAALGESVRSRKFIAAQALERAELAERTREDEARARVDAERLRIAREVHDTVAHAIAIINVQSGVTAHVLDKRPEQAGQTLKAIEQTSARALSEMRAILGVLRNDNDDRVPHRGLAQLDDLAAMAREGGLDVDLETTGQAAPVPSAVSNAVYRIAQESITNVIRHVGPTHVTIALDYGADTVEIRVADTGRQPGSKTEGAVQKTDGGRANGGHTGLGAHGRGLLGMRERCELLGGHLDVGSLPSGGFAVTARLPLAPAGTAGV